MRTLTLAAIQTSPVTCDLDATCQRFVDQVHAVRDTFSHVELVVVPELLLTAEPPLLQARAEWMDQVAEPIPGPLTRRICKLAKKTGLWLVPGSLYERDHNHVYNTTIAVSPRARSPPNTARSFPGSPTSRPHPGPSSWCSTFPVKAGSGWRSAMTDPSRKRRDNWPGWARRWCCSRH